MKLKNLLMLVFFIITLFPVIIILGLFYFSGYNLSKESYIRNITESINVQSNYIAQTMENNRLSDLKFANRTLPLLALETAESKETEQELYEVFQSYLENSEDKLAACMMMDSNNEIFYSIGEKTDIDIVMSQLPELSEIKEQQVMEFVMGEDTYNFGVVTPMHEGDGSYVGSLISIYDKSYLFKIISSYYKIADSATYICRKNGDMINYNKFSDEEQNDAIHQALVLLTLKDENFINMRIDGAVVCGYYKKIPNTPWYLVGFIDNRLVYSFANKFVGIYIIIIVGLAALDMLLAYYFSRKVVEPINDLIKVMDEYQSSLNINELQYEKKNGYYETKYLREKFLQLMKTIMFANHNFKGIYQLYQSSDMGDINIDIDVVKQVTTCNKEKFGNLMNGIEISEDDCVVERFSRCFCEKDQKILMEIMENLRDGHLSVTREAEVYTPYLGKKWFHSLIVPMYEEERLIRLFVQLRDVSNFRKQEYESIEQARRDSLTGLLNRSGFSACVQEKLEEVCGSGMHGLMFIDMNYFKMVNDNLGHSTGDELLCNIGKTILDTVGDTNITARYGGDEFIVFLPDTTEEQTKQMKQKLNQNLVYPYHTDKISFVVSASIGTSIWNNSVPGIFEEMLRLADASMYQAKREFKEGKEQGK